MARRPAIIKRKQKTMRVSRTEQYLINSKYMGDEPVFTKALDITDYLRALNWYSSMCELKDYREYIETHLKNSNRFAEAKKFHLVPDAWVSSATAAVARMLTKGYILPDSAKPFFEKKLKEAFNHIKVAPKTKGDQPKVSVQDRIRDRTMDIIGDIEEKIDSGEKFSLYEWLKGKTIPANYCTSIINHYAPWLGELLEAYEGEDKQLKEAYAYLTKKQLKERIDFINSLIEDAEKYAGVTKKIRAPRKPRPVSVEKKLKDFKYQKEDKDFKIASVNPEKLIGAQELWAFNTKYKTLTVLRAIDRGGLQVKGTSITCYDEKTSVTKRTGRKPEEYIKKVLEGGKIVLRKLMDELTNDAALAYRINENTILLKIA